MPTLRRFAAGEIIIRESEPGETAYVIEQGRVEVTKRLGEENVHLAYLGPEETFGEMSMIDEKPRSATVRAVEETLVREIHRDGFFDCLRTDPDAGLNLLKVLFERLRETQASLLELKRSASRRSAELAGVPLTAAGLQAGVQVSLEGLTQRAVDALPVNPFPIRKFPFRIGRHSHDALAHNDLRIPDSPPHQVSRHHVTLMVRDGRVGVLDRGSALGALVDGQRIGGAKGEAGPAFFRGSEGTLVLGSEDSDFRYRVTVKRSS